METSHSKCCPSPLPPALSGRDLPEGSHKKPGHGPRRLPSTGWPLRASWAGGTTRRSSSRSFCRHPATALQRLRKVPARCFSRVLRTLGSFLGDLDIASSLRMPGLLRRTLLSTAAFMNSCIPGRRLRQPPCRVQGQEVAPCHLPAPQEPCPGRTVITAPEDSGQVVAEQAEHPVDREHQRGRPQVTGRASAFRPLGAHSGVPAFVPRPGPLWRNLCTQSSQDRAESSRAICMSSCPKRNPISSSYSSTRGLRALKRRAPDPSKGEPPLECSSSPGIPPKKAQGEKVAEGRAGHPLPKKKSSPTGDTSRPRKRKFPLLQCRRGEPLKLPPPLLVAHPVTAEDLDREKKKALQHINRLLMGETQAMGNSCAMAPQAHGGVPSPLGGARPLPSVGLSQTFPHPPSSSTMVAHTPVWVSSAVSSQSHPPINNLTGWLSPSLPIAALALPPRPSLSTLAGLPAQPVAPFGVTPLNTTMPSQPPHLGPPSTLGRSFRRSHQGPKPYYTHRPSPVASSSSPARRVRGHIPQGKQPLTPGATVPPSSGVPGGMNPGAPSLVSCHQLGHVGAPGPGAAPMPPLTVGPTTLGSLNYSTLGSDKQRNSTVGPRGSTQTHSVTSKAAGRRDLSLGQTSRKKRSSSESRETPKSREHCGASLGNDTYTAPSQNTTMAPRKHTKEGKKGQGKSGVPTPSAIPQSLPIQKHQSLPQGTSTPTEKGISSLPSVPGTSRRSESPDLLPELMSAFGAWCSSSQRGETPSNRQQQGAMLEQNTSSAPSQSTTMAPRKHTKEGKKGQGKSGVPTPSAIPQSLPIQKHQSLPQGTSTPTEKGISSLPSVPGTSRRSESPDLLPELMSAFGAWCSSSQRGETPSNRQQQGAMLEQNTSSAPSQSTTMAPRKHTKEGKKGQGKSGVPTPSAIPQSLPIQKHQSLPQGTSTPTEKGISSLPSVPGTSRRSESPDLLPELMSAFGAWCSSSQRGGTPSNRQQHGAQLEHNTSSAPSQSTTMGTKGQKARHTPGKATSGVATVTAIPQSLPTQKGLSSPGGTSTTSSKSTSTLTSTRNPSMSPGSPDWLPDLISAFGAMVISPRGETRSVRKR
ncbi:putative POM121-like protein 1-like [Marmota flaviventris]|uniref:putative POM121-like protein 1-like n=1 Tax=Marmota flaviventris TaxID=93162 RepID=UPI003A8437CD